MSPGAAQVYLVLVALLCGVSAASLLAGTGDLANTELCRSFLELRAARAVAAFLAGAALAVGGVIAQGLFQNPLADPSILGTTAGANLGGRLSLYACEVVAGGAAGAWIAPEMMLPLGCVLGALAALGLLLGVQRAGEGLVVLLLTGFLLSSLFTSLAGFVTSLLQERFELARAVMTFALGDVTGVGRQRILLALPLVVAGIVAAICGARSLDLMLSGEEEAAALGVDVREVRRVGVLWIAVLTAAAVAIAGSIGFVGLIVPHVLRPRIGAAHRRLVPASALLGGTFLVACDALTRVLPTRSEIPLGVVTGLIGAPLFLSLLARSRRELQHA